jgi:hypothetical protein
MVQQKGSVWNTKWATDKHPTGVAYRTLLKSADWGRISMRRLGSSPFTIVQKRCRKLIWNGPAERSDLGVKVRRRQTPH